MVRIARLELAAWVDQTLASASAGHIFGVVAGTVAISAVGRGRSRDLTRSIDCGKTTHFAPAPVRGDVRVGVETDGERVTRVRGDARCLEPGLLCRRAPRSGSCTRPRSHSGAWSRRRRVREVTWLRIARGELFARLDRPRHGAVTVYWDPTQSYRERYSARPGLAVKTTGRNVDQWPRTLLRELFGGAGAYHPDVAAPSIVIMGRTRSAMDR